jgi:hypothetical protein
MKKIKSQRFNLGYAQSLTRQQMSNVMGGATLTSKCSINCSGYTLVITGCLGNCATVTDNGGSVSCTSSSGTLTKQCTTVPPAGGNPPA